MTDPDTLTNVHDADDLASRVDDDWRARTGFTKRVIEVVVPTHYDLSLVGGDVLEVEVDPLSGRNTLVRKMPRPPTP